MYSTCGENGETMLSSCVVLCVVLCDILVS
nr:MAG TPA: hypothetical protein [Caudoviricetes sp.]